MAARRSRRGWSPGTDISSWRRPRLYDVGATRQRWHGVTQSRGVWTSPVRVPCVCLTTLSYIPDSLIRPCYYDVTVPVCRSRMYSLFSFVTYLVYYVNTFRLQLFDSRRSHCQKAVVLASVIYSEAKLTTDRWTFRPLGAMWHFGSARFSFCVNAARRKQIRSRLNLHAVLKSACTPVSVVLRRRTAGNRQLSAKYSCTQDNLQFASDCQSAS